LAPTFAGIWPKKAFGSHPAHMAFQQLTFRKVHIDPRIVLRTTYKQPADINIHVQRLSAYAMTTDVQVL
jgi:hypothetical protein